MSGILKIEAKSAYREDWNSVPSNSGRAPLDENWVDWVCFTRLFVFMENASILSTGKSFLKSMASILLICKNGKRKNNCTISLWPITTDAQGPMNQSNRKGNPRRQHRVRKNACELVTISFIDWPRKCR